MGALPQNLTALLVGKDPEAAQAFLTELASDVKFPVSEFQASVLKAVQSLSEEPFSVVFVDEVFPEGELETFFKDMRALGRAETTLFVQLKSAVAPDANRGALKHLGFGTIISRKCTPEDREALLKALRSCFHDQEVRVRKVDVSRVMDKVLRKIDVLADEVRRGRKVDTVDIIPAELVELHTEFDPEVLASYYETLSQTAEMAKPNEVKQLEISEKVLAKNLPGLSKDNYIGASHRVWDKLSKSHGKRKSKSGTLEQPAPEKDESLDTPAKQDTSEDA